MDSLLASADTVGLPFPVSRSASSGPQWLSGDTRTGDEAEWCLAIYGCWPDELDRYTKAQLMQSYVRRLAFESQIQAMEIGRLFAPAAEAARQSPVSVARRAAEPKVSAATLFKQLHADVPKEVM